MFEPHECSKSKGSCRNSKYTCKRKLVNLKKKSALFTEALMIFKLMNLHNTPCFFLTKPQDMSYKRNKNLNEMITSLLIKESINYADMQKDF